MVLSIFFLSLLLKLVLPGIVDEKGWFRVSLPPLRMMAGLIQHFRTAMSGCLAFSCLLPDFLSVRVFWSVFNLLIIKGSLQLLNSTHLRDRDKMLLRAIFVLEEFGTESFLVRPGRKMFLVVFVGRRMVMDIYFGNVPFLPLQHVRDLPEFAFFSCR